MANWTGGRLTKAGRDLQLKVEAGRCKLELTKIKLGDGTEGVDATDNLTDLVGPKAVFGISSVVAKDGMCTVTGVISSSSVTAAFYAREWGLFAKDPDRGEILYMISLDPNPESIPPKTAALKQAATYAMNIVVSNAANIVANIDPAGLVTIKILQDYLSKKVSKNGDTMTGALTLPRLNFGYDSGFEMNKDGVVEITNGGSLYTAGKITAIGGFEGALAGTADNATKFAGKTFDQVKDEIKAQIAIITGQIAHDRTLPLPSGYSEGQCKWFVGINSVSGGAVRCYTDGRIVKCSGDKGSGTANYIVIGVK